MVIGICPKCQDYNVLNVKPLSCGSLITLCDSCVETLNEDDLKPKDLSGFAKNLIATASNLADKGDLYALNTVKKEARKARESQMLTTNELLQVERIFCVLHPI